MLLCWTDDAWADYLYWQAQDRRTPQMGPVRRMVAAHRLSQPYHLYRRRRQALHPLREGPLLNDMGRNGLYHLIDVFGRLGFL